MKIYINQLFASTQFYKIYSKWIFDRFYLIACTKSLCLKPIDTLLFTDRISAVFSDLRNPVDTKSKNILRKSYFEISTPVYA
jgi:hypothetical protein